MSLTAAKVERMGRSRDSAANRRHGSAYRRPPRHPSRSFETLWPRSRLDAGAGYRGAVGLRVFAAVACLLWLAWPTEVFAQQQSIGVDSITGDDLVDVSEKSNGFILSGYTNAGPNETIDILLKYSSDEGANYSDNGEPLQTTTESGPSDSQGNWRWELNVDANADYIIHGKYQRVTAIAFEGESNQISHTRNFGVDLNLPPEIHLETVNGIEIETDINWDENRSIVNEIVSYPFSDPDNSNLSFYATGDDARFFDIRQSLVANTPNLSVAFEDSATFYNDFETPQDEDGNNTYEFTLNVTDNDPDFPKTASLDVTVNVKNVEEPPTADAGVNQTVDEGATVTLDGSASFDPEEDELTYAWTQTAPTSGVGSGLTLAPDPDDSTNAAVRTFTAPDVSSNLTLEFKLTVTAGGDEDSDKVEIHVQPLPPDAPTGLGAEVDSKKIKLSWDNPDDDEITGYQVSSDGGESFSNITSDASTTEHTVTGLDNGTEYKFAVRAMNNVGPGEPTFVDATPLWHAPKNLTAETHTRRVDLTWELGPTEFESFRVRSTVNGEQERLQLIGRGDSNSSTITVEVFTTYGGVEYTFSVWALSNQDLSSPISRTAEVKATPNVGDRPPAPPTEFEASSGEDRQITLSWENPNDDTILGYEYRISDDGGIIWHRGWIDIPNSNNSTTGHTVTELYHNIPLTNGDTYTLQVRAKNTPGFSNEAEATATPLWPAPAGLNAKPNDSQVKLEWSDPNNSNITGYQVSSDGGASFSDITSDASTTEYTVTGLTNGTEYSFAVRVVNGNQSIVIATPNPIPAAPAGLSATPGDKQVTLNWSDPHNASIEHWEYQQKEGDQDWQDWMAIQQSTATTAEHTVPDLTNGTNYKFKVRAVNATGKGVASDEVNVVPLGPPATPTNLLATSGEDRKTTLSWDDPSDSTITTYQYRVSGDNGQTWNPDWTAIGGSNANTTGHTLTGLTNGIEYTFEVRALNNSVPGNSAAAKATPLLPAPADLEAMSGNGQVNLQWTTGSATEISGYHVEIIDGNVLRTETVDRGSDSTTTLVVDSLTNGTEYTFKVWAVDDQDVTISNVSETMATPLAAPAAPVAPTNLLATSGEDRKTTLSWDDPSDSTITTYQYRVSGDNGQTWNPDWTAISGSNANTTGHIVTGLTNGIEYKIQVRAENNSGFSEPSNTATATPLSPVPAPEGLQATSGGDGRTTLSWSNPDNDDITGYEYRVSDDSGSNWNPDWTAIGGSDANTTGHIVTGLTNGIEHTLAVRARNIFGPGAANTANATPLWPAPTNLKATPDNGRVHLEWDTNPRVAEYEVEIKQANTSSTATFAAGSGPKTTAVIDSLTNGAQYTFSVSAVDDQRETISHVSETMATPEASLPVPAAPENLSATPSDSQVTLTWNDPGNITITGYKYRFSENNGQTWKLDWTAISGSNASTTRYTVSGLTNEIEHKFEVHALNNSGDGLAAAVIATPADDAPTASDFMVSMDEDTTHTFMANDFLFMSVKSGATLNHVKITSLPEPNQGTLSVRGAAIASVSLPRVVTKAELDTGQLEYTPPANANGDNLATFKFKANDGVADSKEAYTVTINVNAVSDRIAGSDNTVSINEDNDYVFSAADFPFSDVDDARAELNHVKIIKLPGPNQGTLSIGGMAIAAGGQVTKAQLDAGLLKYTPPANANGVPFATFDFKVNDGEEDSEEAYTITINVHAVNDPPEAKPDNAQTSAGADVVIGVLENDSDVDTGTFLQVKEVGYPIAPSQGTVEINANETTITYTPNANADVNVTDTFSYTVTDGIDVNEGQVEVDFLSNGANANLSNLTLSSGTLRPDFAATTTSYAATVNATTSRLKVTPTAAEANATVTVNGTPVASGNPSGDIALSQGDTTTIEVIVRSEDRSITKTTTIGVFRSRFVDETRPEVEIQTEATAPVGGAFEVAIHFSESVYGFVPRDIGVSNGTSSNFNKVSAQDYTFTITPEETGEVTVEIAAGVASDAVGNANKAAEPLVIEADLTRPGVVIASEAAAPVGGAFEVSVTFDEAVTGFEQSGIAVTNGTVTGFSGSGMDYTAEITPALGGEVSVRVEADAAADAAGNGNEAAEPFVIEADLAGPTVEIASEAAGPVSGAFTATFAFSEAVTGFERSDVQVTNGAVIGFSGSGTNYTAEIDPAESGEVTVSIAADTAEDAAGNGNEAAQPFLIAADLERPRVTVTGPADPVPAGVGGFQVTIAFSEPVQGFAREDIQLGNATLTDFVATSSLVYQATIDPAAPGQPVVVEIPADVAADLAGNGNQAAEPFQVEAKLVVSYQEADYTAIEGGEAATVTLKLSQAANQALAIPIRLTRPETTAVDDYTVEGLSDWDAVAGAGTLDFPADATEQTFRIVANHDGDGNDETLELGFGDLPEIAMTGEAAAATVTLKDKGLLDLQVSFGQANYTVIEGQQAEIEVTMSPAADRAVDIPLLVTLEGGATPEDYSGIPASLAFAQGESRSVVSLAVAADEAHDPGEGIVLRLGELPKAVNAGEPASTQVRFEQRRTAEQFARTQEALLAVVARSMGESALTAIEGRFERHRQWSRLGAAAGEPPPPESNAGAAAPSASASGLAGNESVTAGQVLNAADQSALGADRGGAPAVSSMRGFSPGPPANFAAGHRMQPGASPGFGEAPGGAAFGHNPGSGSGFGNAAPGILAGQTSGVGNSTRNLSAAAFEMPLGKQQQQTSWAPVLWGQGDMQHFNGDLERLGMDYRGGLDAAHVGLDLYADERMLAGLSVMRSWGELDYSDDGTDGLLRSRMDTAHPYLYWQPNERVSVWGVGGFGAGDVGLEELGRAHDFDADFGMFAGGVRALLSRRGNNEWALRADALSTRLATDASADIADVSGDAHRGRLMLEWVRDESLSAGRSLSLKLEAGGRFDGGDADRGAGMETGFRVAYLDANRGLDVSLHGRVLLVHESGYRDWGAGVQASWDPGLKQRGFRASVTSSWGRDGDGRTTLWDNADAVTSPLQAGALGQGPRFRMESELAWGGLKALGLPGLFTPYSRLRWAGQGREIAWGTSWNLLAKGQSALPFTLELESVQHASTMGRSEYGLLLRLSIPF